MSPLLEPERISHVQTIVQGPENHDFYQKLDTKFDIRRLQDEVLEIREKYPPVLRGTAWGGWSLLSATGQYQSGWELGHLCYSEEDGQTVLDPDKLAEIGYQPAWKHSRPTEVLRPQLLQVLKTVKEMNLLPCRARLALLSPFSSGSIHRDGLDDQYAVRLHVPIFTNEACIFACEEGWAHWPADGSSYIVRVNQFHQVLNQSSEDRVHLVTDIFDRSGVTRFPIQERRSFHN